jgi:hypothetical protein
VASATGDGAGEDSAALGVGAACGGAACGVVARGGVAVWGRLAHPLMPRVTITAHVRAQRITLTFLHIGRFCAYPTGIVEVAEAAEAEPGYPVPTNPG